MTCRTCILLPTFELVNKDVEGTGLSLLLTTPQELDQELR